MTIKEEINLLKKFDLMSDNIKKVIFLKKSIIFIHINMYNILTMKTNLMKTK